MNGTQIDYDIIISMLKCIARCPLVTHAKFEGISD